MCCRSSLTSLVQFMRFLPRKPSVHDALAAVMSTCIFHERSSLMLTPKYLALSDAARIYPCCVYTGFLCCLLFVHMWMTWHFWGLNRICHLSSHSARESRSCCRRAASSSFLICLNSSAASENNLVSLALQSGRSLINARKNSGPSIVPWGTPDTTSACEETTPSSRIHYFLWLRNDSIQVRVSPRTP